jgi:hypothetical protein
MRLVSRSLLLCLIIAVAACGAHKLYRLPITLDDEGPTVQLLLDAATKRGWDAKSGNGVESGQPYLHVTFADGTSFAVSVGSNSGLPLVDVKADSGKTPKAELAARIDAAKAKFDEIWREAMATRGGTPPPATPVEDSTK